MKKAKEEPVSDLLALAEAAFGALLGAQKEIGAALLSKRETLVRKLDLVTREEFDAAFAMLKKTRALQSDLEKRLAAVEKKSGLSRADKSPTKKQKPSK